jgi:hypothetical protein
LKRMMVLILMVLAVTALFTGTAFSNDSSYVIGRITGTQRPLPGYFENNMRLAARGIDRVEFYGFRLIRKTDGETFLLRPTHEGFFYQKLPGGTYTLTRKRNDRPDYRRPKTLDILTFDVDPGTLVNLGTIDLVLEGEPEAKVMHRQKVVKGTFIYRYRYERSVGDQGFLSPLGWFSGKKPDEARGYDGRRVRVETMPASVVDGSRVRLRESYRIDDD